MGSIQVPRAIDITGHRSPDEIAFDRESEAIARRRRDLAAKLKYAGTQIKGSTRPKIMGSAMPTYRHAAWKSLARSTRSC